MHILLKRILLRKQILPRKRKNLLLYMNLPQARLLPTKRLPNYIKAANDARISQLESIVHKLIAGQGDAYGKATNMWQFLAGGNFTVDAATKAQAQADIAEDGYWGVNATSDRIVDFAVALAGDDPEKLEEMRSAFLQGFNKAKETWGGELPDISQRTYDAVMQKFDKLTGKAEETTATN